jgi:hypothetical protein
MPCPNCHCNRCEITAHVTYSVDKKSGDVISTCERGSKEKAEEYVAMWRKDFDTILVYVPSIFRMPGPKEKCANCSCSDCETEMIVYILHKYKDGNYVSSDGFHSMEKLREAQNWWNKPVGSGTTLYSCLRGGTLKVPKTYDGKE